MKSKRPLLGKTMINRYIHICVLKKQSYLQGNKFREYLISRLECITLQSYAKYFEKN